MATCDLIVRVAIARLEPEHVDVKRLWDDISETLNVNIENVRLAEAVTARDDRVPAVEVRVGHDLTGDDIDYITGQVRAHVRQNAGMALIGNGVSYRETIVGAVEAESGGSHFTSADISLTDEDLRGFGEVFHDEGYPRAVYGPLTNAEFPDDEDELELTIDAAETFAEFREDRHDPRGAAAYRKLADRLRDRL